MKFYRVGFLKKWKSRIKFLCSPNCDMQLLAGLIFVVLGGILLIYLLDGEFTVGTLTTSEKIKNSFMANLFGMGIQYIGITFISFSSSVMMTTFLGSLLFKKEIKSAVPYSTLERLASLSDLNDMAHFIQFHKLRVYISREKFTEEVARIKGKRLLFFTSPLFLPMFRGMFRIFGEVYFEKEQLEKAMRKELVSIERLVPEMLLEKANLKKETIVKLETAVKKEKANQGWQGRIDMLTNQLNYYKLYCFVLTRLSFVFTSEWKEKGYKPINRPRIDIVTAEIRDSFPDISQAITAIKVRGSPYILSSMTDFFLYALPDEMLDPRCPKPTFSNLMKKHITKPASED